MRYLNKLIAWVNSLTLLFLIMACDSFTTPSQFVMLFVSGGIFALQIYLNLYFRKDELFYEYELNTNTRK